MPSVAAPVIPVPVRCAQPVITSAFPDAKKPNTCFILSHTPSALQISSATSIIASKVKYLFIIGDLIDGIGIYPGQEDELTINDLTKQYEAVADYLIQIPSHIQIIICPGNHDGVRLAEPQPVLYKDLAKSLWDISNVTMVTNPAYINIHASEGFPGFDVLMYHGYSFDYYVANVDSIRNNGGYDRGDLIMMFKLQKRHLAPSHNSTANIPE